MTVKCDEYNQVCVMSIDGEFAGEATQVARKQVEEYIDKKQVVDFVIDFEKCGFIDSEGLETLLWIKRRCEDLFGRFKVANLDENCRKIMEITRMDHRMENHADLPGALKAMR